MKKIFCNVCECEIKREGSLAFLDDPYIWNGFEMLINIVSTIESSDMNDSDMHICNSCRLNMFKDFIRTKSVELIDELPPEATLENLPIAEAALQCLRKEGHPLTIYDLADRLLKYGFQTQSDNFKNTLSTTLSVNMKKYGTFARFEGSKWGLSEWQNK